MTSREGLSFYKNSHVMIVDGYDDCIVGYDAEDDRLVYSKDKMIEHLCVTQQYGLLMWVTTLQFLFGPSMTSLKK